MMSSTEHIILYLSLFLLMYLWGKWSYDKPAWKFWIGALVPVLCFSLITGCRAWGVDYEWYRYKMTHPGDLSVRQDERLFLLLNGMIRLLGLEGTGGFVIYSAIIMAGALAFIRSLGGYSKYMYALLLPAILIETMVHIRQGIAFGVALAGLAFMNRRDWKMFALFSLMAFNIHPVSAILPAASLALYYLRDRIVPAQIGVPLYCAAIFLPKYVNYAVIQRLLHLLPVEGSKYTVYIRHMSTMFSEKANQLDWMQSPVALALSALFDISIMSLSYWYLRKVRAPLVNIYYNMFVLGAILLRTFFLNDLLRRTFTIYYMLYFVPLGYCLFLYNIGGATLADRRVNAFAVGFACIMAYLAAYWGRFIFLNGEAVFVWQ